MKQKPSNRNQETKKIEVVASDDACPTIEHTGDRRSTRGWRIDAGDWDALSGAGRIVTRLAGVLPGEADLDAGHLANRQVTTTHEVRALQADAQAL